MTFCRSQEMDDFCVVTSCENNCAIMPCCYFFKIFFMPLEFIIFPGFPTIPLIQFLFLPRKISRRVLEN